MNVNMIRIKYINFSCYTVMTVKINFKLPTELKRVISSVKKLLIAT